ncbi:MAG: hypothetical protein ACK5YC_11810, partial [Planctomyces sp.]
QRVFVRAVKPKSAAGAEPRMQFFTRDAVLRTDELGASGRNRIGCGQKSIKSVCLTKLRRVSGALRTLVPLPVYRLSSGCGRGEDYICFVD